MTYYFIDDFDNICRQKDGMDKDFAEVIDLIELINDINKIQEENEQLRKEKIDAEVKLYSANEKILMQMDYDEIIKQNTENEIEITNLKKENEQLNETFQILYEQYKDALKIIKNLKKENEDLKTTISNYMDCIDKLYIENERLKRKLEFEEYKNRSYNKELDEGV